MQAAIKHDDQDYLKLSTELATGVIKKMLKDIVQEMLKAELEDMLGYDKYAVSKKAIENSRNGYSKKTLRTRLGPIEINVPRDRNGEFKPKLISRYARSMSSLEEQLLSICLAGAARDDLQNHIAALYSGNANTSNGFVERIADKIIPEVVKWQNLLSPGD